MAGQQREHLIEAEPAQLAITTWSSSRLHEYQDGALGEGCSRKQPRV